MTDIWIDDDIYWERQKPIPVSATYPSVPPIIEMEMNILVSISHWGVFDIAPFGGIERDGIVEWSDGTTGIAWAVEQIMRPVMS